MKNLDDTYFVEIEAAFNRHRGSFKILSPLDWSLMQEWNERGIPLKIVLRGMENAFDGRNPGKKPETINTLRYCRRAVESAFYEYSQNQVGAAVEAMPDALAATESPRTAITDDEFAEVCAALQSIIEKLDDLRRRSARQIPMSSFAVLTDTRRQVVSLKSEFENRRDFDELEIRLNQLELPFLLALTNCVSTETKKQWLDEIQTGFRSTSMSAQYRAETAKRLLEDKIRAHFDAPKLTIFYF